MIALSKKPKPASSATLPAVVYIRMSDDRQAESPDQQRTEIAKLAERYGYHLTGEYLDSGISGDDIRRRKDFRRMIADAAKGEFKAILVWDISRFGRFDSIEAGEWISPLRRAGVKLVTVAEGVIDWSDFASRMLYSIQQEGKHTFLVDLSRNTTRGLGAKAKAGEAMTNPCYGFDRVYHDRSGKEVHRVPYGERFSKPKEWTVNLVPSADAEAVRVVRWLFERFATTDTSGQALAMELNRQGTKSPGGKAWDPSRVVDILRNPVYVGTYVYGRGKVGKFHHVGSDGEITASKDNAVRATPVVTIENHHPAIVDRATFDACEAKMLSRQRDRRAPRARGFPLSGTLTCGDCGGQLRGITNGPEGSKRRYYMCRNAVLGLCECRRMNAIRIEGMLAEMAREWLLAPDLQKQLRAALSQNATADRKATPDTLKGLRAEVAKLDRQIERGTKNMMLADPDDVPAAKIVLAEWRQERKAAQARLDAAQAPVKRSDSTVEGTVERALAKLQSVAENLEAVEPAVSREAFRTVFYGATLYWHARKPGQRNWVPSKLVVEVRTPLDLASALT